MNWEAIGQFFIENIGYLYQNFSLYSVVLMVVTMSIIIAFCALLKKPIKALTKKIKNEKVRKLCNKTIILMAYGISIGLYYLLAWLLPQYIVVDWAQITLSASLSIVAYALGDGVITKSTANNLVQNIKDKDNTAISEFYDKVK